MMKYLGELYRLRHVWRLEGGSTETEQSRARSPGQQNLSGLIGSLSLNRIEVSSPIDSLIESEKHKKLAVCVGE